MPVCHQGEHRVENLPANRADSLVMILQVSSQALPVFVAFAANLTRMGLLRCVNLSDMLLDYRRRCEHRWTLGTLGSLLGVPKHVAV